MGKNCVGLDNFSETFLCCCSVASVRFNGVALGAVFKLISILDIPTTLICFSIIVDTNETWLLDKSVNRENNDFF